MTEVMQEVPDQNVTELLSDRIRCLEARFETRFDRLETRLDQWMESNGKQNVKIQKNTDKIDGLYRRIERKGKWNLAITIGIASCTATLLSAFIQILVKYVSRS